MWAKEEQLGRSGRFISFIDFYFKVWIMQREKLRKLKTRMSTFGERKENLNSRRQLSWSLTRKWQRFEMKFLTFVYWLDWRTSSCSLVMEWVCRLSRLPGLTRVSSRSGDDQVISLSLSHLNRARQTGNSWQIMTGAPPCSHGKSFLMLVSAR